MQQPSVYRTSRCCPGSCSTTTSTTSSSSATTASRGLRQRVVTSGLFRCTLLLPQSLWCVEYVLSHMVDRSSTGARLLGESLRGSRSARGVRSGTAHRQAVTSPSGWRAHGGAVRRRRNHRFHRRGLMRIYVRVETLGEKRSYRQGGACLEHEHEHERDGEGER